MAMISTEGSGPGLRRLRALAVRVALAVALAMVAMNSIAAQAPPDLREAMARELTAQQLQGATWAIVDGDAIATGAAGVADARDRRALRDSDQVHVGSIAKTLLATGVLRLVSEGRLALDAPVATLLPGVAFDNPWAASDPVRVRHLLDHTAGLDDARLAQVFSLAPRADTPLAQAFARVVPLRVRSRPGSRHSYSNSGYTLLGMIVEAVTGARYEAYLDAHLLAPLGLRDSTFAFTTQARAPRLAMGHFENGVAQAAVPMSLRPAAQFTTTAADMGRLAQFLMGDGRIDGASFIDAALLRAMGHAVRTEAADAGLKVGYGLGLATRDRHGAVGQCHGGSTVGYRAMLCLFPAQRRAFFVAINADAEGADYGRIDALLVDALGVRGAPAAPRVADVAASTAWDGWYVPAPNRFAQFAWLDGTFNYVRVQRDGGRLRLTSLQSPDVMLAPAGASSWRAEDRTLASHALLVSREGTCVLSTGLQSWEQASLARMLASWIPLAAGLLGATWLLLAGVFDLATQRRKVVARPGFVPFLGLLALAIPVPLFLRQSFLQLGDATPASVALAAVTLLLPLAMLAGLVVALRRRPWSARTRVDVAAMGGVLALCAVLATWGLLPLRLWS
jgi:CubicO group peptidase (beta-lactamase class C family)